MSRRRYDNGQLVEEWDDPAQTYRRFEDGALVETRAYTVAEIAGILGLGGVTITDNDVVMLGEDGTVMFRLGPQINGDFGFQISREDGTKAFTLSRLFAISTQQELRLFDRFGNGLVEEEALGAGMSKPMLPIVMRPIQAAAATLLAGPHGWEVPTSDAAWVTIFQSNYPRHNQYGTFRAMIAASDATTAAEMRLINAADGNHLGQFLAGPYTATRAAGGTAYVETVLPSIVLPGDPHADASLALQVRRTAGTGTLQVALTYSNGG